MDKENQEREINNYFYDIFIITILFFLSLFLRLYNYKEMGVAPDEVIYSNYAYSILSHNWSWPKHYMYGQPPFLPYILAILTYLFGGDLKIFRLVPIIFGSLSVSMLYVLGKELFDRKVGILSSLLLGFSSIHILYSRTVMLESMLIFFILGSIYFFWKSYYVKRNFKSAVLAGVFLGLAIDTKYVGLLLIPIFIIFILWTNRNGFFSLNLKSLIEKNLVITLFTSLIVFAPVLINLYLKRVNPFYYYLFGIFEKPFAGHKSYGASNLLFRGYNNYVDILIDKNSIATSQFPFFEAFHSVTFILLGIAMVYSLYFMTKNFPNVSLIMIYFVIFNLFVAYYGRRFSYYLLWSLPGFYIMITYMLVDLAQKIKFSSTTNFSLRLWTSFPILVLTFIFISSTVVVGAMAPSVNEALKIGYERQISKLKNDLQPREYIFTDKRDITGYYVQKLDINEKSQEIYILPLFKTFETPTAKEKKINFELLDEFKPRFIITDTYFFDAYTKTSDLKRLQNDYNLISDESGVLLFERKSFNPL
jgi:4-amino-4-deoxy-L-arabinose transferase-like glycosyltransferase